MRTFHLKNISLSVLTDVPVSLGKKSPTEKWITYYDPQKIEQYKRKAIDDFEFDQRRQDAVLLRDLCKAYYDQATNSGFITVNKKVMDAMNMLLTVATVLTTERSNEPLYRFMAPYGQPLIYQASVHISCALDEAHCGLLMRPTQHIERLYDALLRLARDAEKRYLVEQYAD